MTCDEARALLLDAQRGRLPADGREALRGHVAGCEACTHEEAADALLSEALEHRLPSHAAPLALKRRLAAAWPAVLPAVLPAVPPAGPMDEPARPRGWAWRRLLVPALAMAVLVLAALPLYYPGPDRGQVMVTEAVNDHLRLLSSQHPLDIESGGMHQVKPWFEGRLDFAPVVRFLGDDDIPLRGGAIGYYLDRKAAVFVFHRRLHAITLLVFQADGLPWSRRGLETIGAVRAQVTASRGFNAIVWREGELGYALVSDVETPELRQLVGRLAPTS
jgi:anti-sigma factor RsiW